VSRVAEKAEIQVFRKPSLLFGLIREKKTTLNSSSGIKGSCVSNTAGTAHGYQQDSCDRKMVIFHHRSESHSGQTKVTVECAGTLELIPSLWYSYHKLH
jgi:hypothetical protein